MTIDENSPADALELIRRSQSATADRISRGGWLYDTIYSVLLAGMIAGAALGLPRGLAVVTACGALLLLLAFTWAKHHGVWLSGVTPLRARWVAFGLSACLVPLYLLSTWAALHHWSPAVPVAAGFATFVVALAGSRLWRRVYRREMGLNP
ncbi:MAG: hypothetical protein ACXU8U_11050 [Asticcacaulis sp.]